MFKKRETETENTGTDRSETKPMEDHTENQGRKRMDRKMDGGSTNTILKGSKLTGDINVTCDLELSGDVVGNILSNESSNISIKGTCKGNIETRGGNVNIEGELLEGNIAAGNDVRISGKFNGGEVRAKGSIYVNGEFKGRLEANEIEIGSSAQGEGELLYKETISIAKGARIEATISQAQPELKLVKDSPGKQPMDGTPPEKEMKEGN